MKKISLLFLSLTVLLTAIAQKETFDLVNFTSLKGWKKEQAAESVNYSIVDSKKNSWCKIFLYKSIASNGNIEDDFNQDWLELVATPYKTPAPFQTNPVQDADGWKMKTGAGKFTFNNSDAMVMLTSITGYNKKVSILAMTNSQGYLPQIQNFLESINLKKPVTTTITTPVAALPVTKNGFSFTTTNFDDGWTGTVQEDWVAVTKGDTRVLIHYPNKQADAYNSVVLDGLKNAWNILVAPRYSTASNFEFKPLTGWQSIEFAEADAVERSTGSTVHVVLFKMNYSNGSGRYLEFITTNKTAFEQEFGAYHPTTYGWEKMEHMASYNKFAVAATDLTGKWTTDFSGTIQYVSASTGLDAGMDTHASNENYSIAANKSYTWDLAVASGPIGNIKFQSVKSRGTLSMAGNWKINFSDIEGKPRNYDIYFSCIKGLRILWINNRPFAKNN